MTTAGDALPHVVDAAMEPHEEIVRHWIRMFAVAVLLAMPAAAQAQNPQARSGFWGNFGLGWGSLGCEDCDGREGSLSGGLALGGTINQKVAIGVGTNGWSKEEDGVTLTAGSLTALIRFYPSATGGFFLLGGLGLGSVSLEIDGFGSASDEGTAALLGVGYDFRIGRNVSLTPFYNGVGIVAGDGNANFGQLGIGITIH